MGGAWWRAQFPKAHIHGMHGESYPRSNIYRPTLGVWLDREWLRLYLTQTETREPWKDC